MPFAATAEDFTNAIAAYLQHYVHAQLPHGCMVVGIVDEHGPSVISCGDLDNGTDRQADGDTLFAIQSSSYTFFCLLLEDMVERGEMQPDDPVAKYLPASVKMPTYHGKQITVRQLAKETSGLRPSLGDAIDPKRADNPFEGFTAEKFFALVSNCQSNLRTGDDAFARRRGPRGVESSPGPESRDGLRIAPALSRAPAVEHERHGAHADPRAGIPPGPRTQQVRLTPCRDGSEGDFILLAGVYSTANDLLKFLSASVPASSRLRPLWERTVANFAFLRRDPDCSTPAEAGLPTVVTSGSTRRAGVVWSSWLMPTSPGANLGILLLESEWQSDRRPQPAKVSRRLCAVIRRTIPTLTQLCAGQLCAPALCVRCAPHGHAASGGPQPGSVGRAALARRQAPRKRLFILCWVVLAGVVSAPLLPLLASRIFCARLHPGIGIRCEGDRLFAEPTGSDCARSRIGRALRPGDEKCYPIDVLFPPMPVELLPESETRCFERLSGVPMTFARDARGKVTSLALHYRGQDFIYDKISDVPPKAPEPVKPPVIVNLDTNVLDACVGRYEIAPGAAFPKGLKVTVWREGAQLLGRAQHPGGDRVLLGAFPLFPESETNFFEKLTGAQFRFTRNDQGQVTALTHHYTGATLAWFPDWEAKKAPTGTIQKEGR